MVLMFTYSCLLNLKLKVLLRIVYRCGFKIFYVTRCRDGCNGYV